MLEGEDGTVPYARRSVWTHLGRSDQQTTANEASRGTARCSLNSPATAGIGGKGDDWWKHPEHFDPEKLDQDMDVMVMGNVLGFEGNPAGFEHAVIMQQNLTICSTDELAKGTCTPGHERLVCVERFAYCAGGDCKGKNVEALSPRDDACAPAPDGHCATTLRQRNCIHCVQLSSAPP
jgi:hypothetical protein